MHLVGYLCHTLLVLSNRLVFGSSCQGCLFFLSSFRFLHFTQIIITCFGEALFSVSLHVDIVWFAIPISLVGAFLLSADGFFP